MRMDINFDDLKKEFDALKAVQNIKEEACEIGCETAEGKEEGSFIEIMQKNMLPPAKCGIYFSRLDIKVIGLKFGEDVQVRERKRMIRDILRAVTSKEELARLFFIIDETAQEKIAVYDQLSTLFPASKELFVPKKERYDNFKKIMENILEEFDEAVEQE